MRIVFDTNILVRAHANARGPARELLLLVTATPAHKLLLSPFLLQELERVFGYPRVRKSTRLTDDETSEYLRYLRSREVSELMCFLGLRHGLFPPTSAAGFVSVLTPVLY